MKIYIILGWNNYFTEGGQWQVGIGRASTRGSYNYINLCTSGQWQLCTEGMGGYWGYIYVGGLDGYTHYRTWHN